MRKLIAIAWKDTQVRFSSPLEWLFFLVLPIVFTVALAAATGGGDQRARLVVVDQAGTAASSLFAESLRSARGIRMDLLPLANGEAELRARRTSALLEIPQGFDLAALAAGTAALELRAQPASL